MSRQAEHLVALAQSADWRGYILAHSGLPGPRGNLELLAAAASWVEPSLGFELAALPLEQAPGNAPEVLLVMSGVVVLARLALAGDERPWDVWARLAADPRWRVREAVAMALQHVGDGDWPLLAERVRPWWHASPWQQRALVAGLCEPRLLTEPERVVYTFDALEAATVDLARQPDRRDEGVRVLRQALGYAWSVAMVAQPEEGWRRLEAWARSPDADVRWVVRENLGKARLTRLDAARVARWRAILSGASDEPRQ